jgi:hypothetical protein
MSEIAERRFGQDAISLPCPSVIAALFSITYRFFGTQFMIRTIL